MSRRTKGKAPRIGTSPFYESYLRAKRGQTEATRHEHATGATPSPASAKDPHISKGRGHAGTDTRDDVGEDPGIDHRQPPDGTTD